jgi:hypothetical protein
MVRDDVMVEITVTFLAALPHWILVHLLSVMSKKNQRKVFETKGSGGLFSRPPLPPQGRE